MPYVPSLVKPEAFAAEVDFDFILVVCQYPGTKERTATTDHNRYSPIIVHLFIDPKERSIRLQRQTTTVHFPASSSMEPARELASHRRQSNLVTLSNLEGAVRDLQSGKKALIVQMVWSLTNVRKDGHILEYFVSLIVRNV